MFFEKKLPNEEKLVEEVIQNKETKKQNFEKTPEELEKYLYEVIEHKKNLLEKYVNKLVQLGLPEKQKLQIEKKIFSDLNNELGKILKDVKNKPVNVDNVVKDILDDISTNPSLYIDKITKITNISDLDQLLRFSKHSYLLQKKILSKFDWEGGNYGNDDYSFYTLLRDVEDFPDLQSYVVNKFKGDIKHGDVLDNIFFVVKKPKFLSKIIDKFVGVINKIHYAEHMLSLLDKQKNKELEEKLWIKFSPIVKLYFGIKRSNTLEEKEQNIDKFHGRIKDLQSVEDFLILLKGHKKLQKKILEKADIKVHTIYTLRSFLNKIDNFKHYPDLKEPLKKICANVGLKYYIDLCYVKDEKSRDLVLKKLGSKIESLQELIGMLNIVNMGDDEDNILVESYKHNILNEASYFYQDIDLLINVAVRVKKYSKDKVIAKCLEWFKNNDKKYIEVATLVMIGLGLKVNGFNNEELKKIANILYKTGRTRIKVDDIAGDPFFVNIAKQKKMSLARYLSTLIAVSKQTNNLVEKRKLFLEKVAFQEKIKNEPILQGDYLVNIIYGREDGTEALTISSQNAFDSTYMTRLAKNKCMKEIDYKYSLGDNIAKKIDDILDNIPSGKKVTLYLAGHGESKGIDGAHESAIFFGIDTNNGVLKMNQLLQILEKHIDKVKMVIFYSCYSDANAMNEILSKWNPEKLPPIILTSSNEFSPTLKVITDSWNYFSKYVVPNLKDEHGNPKVATWGDFWDYLEGRLMVLGNFSVISDPALFWPSKGAISKYKFNLMHNNSMSKNIIFGKAEKSHDKKVKEELLKNVIEVSSYNGDNNEKVS